MEETEILANRADKLVADRYLRREMKAYGLSSEKLERVVTAGLRKFLDEEDCHSGQFPRLRGLTGMLRFLVNPTRDEVEAVEKDADSLFAFYEGQFGGDDKSARIIATARETGDHATLAIACYRVLRDDGASQASVVLGGAVGGALFELMTGTTRASLLPKSETRLKACAKASPPAARRKAG